MRSAAPAIVRSVLGLAGQHFVQLRSSTALCNGLINQGSLTVLSDGLINQGSVSAIWNQHRSYNKMRQGGSKRRNAATRKSSDTKHSSSCVGEMRKKSLKKLEIIHHGVIPAEPKRVSLVLQSQGVAGAVFSVRIKDDHDLRQMLNGTSTVCLVPATKEKLSSEWRVAGDGTRSFADLDERTVYMMVSRSTSSTREAQPPDASDAAGITERFTYSDMMKLRETVINVRRELLNRARGEEGELTEAMLRLFPDMESCPNRRILNNEEVDAVLSGHDSVAIGFHCNKISMAEVRAAAARVSGWLALARSRSSSAHSFLYGKDVFVVMSANFVPPKEMTNVISACRDLNFVLLLRNGTNLSMHNSIVPHQQTISPVSL